MNETVNSKVDFKVLEGILQSFDYKKSYLIAMLQKVQAIYKYLPEEAMTYIGEHVDGLSPATVFGVATFYAQFSLEPKGKYEIKVCDGTACHVRKSIPILEKLRSELGLSAEKKTTDDLNFTVETVSCLGACGLAPVLTVNDVVHAEMTPEKAVALLNKLKEEIDHAE